MFTLFSTQTSLGQEIKQVCVVTDGYATALYNISEYAKELGEEDFTIKKSDNTLWLERGDVEVTQFRVEGDVSKDEEWCKGFEFLGFIS